MTEQLITFQTNPRAAALELLANPDEINVTIRKWENGDRLTWTVMSPEDPRPEGFEGLKLVLRRISNVVTAIVSKEQIESDTEGVVTEALIAELRKSSLPTEKKAE